MLIRYPPPLLSRSLTTRTALGGSSALLSLNSLWISLRHASTYNDRTVRIVEVGPRDGLQNIEQLLSKNTKVEFIKRLKHTGLLNIEATSFVSPKWVPQLADGHDVMKSILRFAQDQSQSNQVRFPVLAPNLKGLRNAKSAGATEVVVFASATEAFSKANQNCTVDEAIAQARAVTREALSSGMKVRGVISCIFSDPFTGPTAPKDVLAVARQFIDIGCYEVGLGDTLGVGTPADTQAVLEVLLQEIPPDKLAGHFHDTYGQGIANIFRAYEMGIRTFDSSVAGLGGCPYAPGAKGNVATEDIVYGFEKAGIHTGVDLEKLVDVGHWISQQIGIPYGSRAGAALASKRIGKKGPDKSATLESARKWTVVEDTGEYVVSRAGTALKITLTRPKNGNAMTDAMLVGLTDLFRNVCDDGSVYNIIIEAEGKYFCTGMDLSGDTNTSDNSMESSYYSRVAALFDAIDRVPQTTIALVDGPCFGGGVGLTFACDIRLVSPKARWTLSEVKIGVSPAIISKFLVREWGASTAREGMLSGREITPDELFRVGAIHAISKEGKSLTSDLDGYLNQLEKCAPRAAAVNKELIRVGWNDPESVAQTTLIAGTFKNMMSSGSEGQHGIQQFQKRSKFNWKDFWESRNPFDNVYAGKKSRAKDSDLVKDP